jgi:nucleoside-diphosphate-sugar epimerase
MTNKIVLIGATGWFGLCFLDIYYQVFGNKIRTYLILVTSDGRDINHPNIPFSLNSLSLSDLENIELSNFSLIQAAFLTRDKIQSLGFSDYVNKNLSIIGSIENFVSKNKPSNFFLISSGATYNDNSLYGVLKREEKRRFKSLNNQGVNVIVFNVFGAIGKSCSYRNWSAVCDFLKSAIGRNVIKFNSDGSVMRGFVSFDDLSKLIINIISTEEYANFEIDAVSNNYDLYSVAKYISSSKKVSLSVSDYFDQANVVSNYSSDFSNFRSLCEKYNVPIKIDYSFFDTHLNNYFLDTYK